MGFFQDLGLDELMSSVREMTSEISGLKDDIVTSVIGPADDLKSTVQDITASVSGNDSAVTDQPTE